MAKKKAAKKKAAKKKAVGRRPKAEGKEATAKKKPPSPRPSPRGRGGKAAAKKKPARKAASGPRRRKRRPSTGKGLSAYEARKERERRRQAAMSAGGRDIGEIPKVKNRRRRNRAVKDFEYFCRVYFPERFPLPFCDDHKKVIGKVETAVAGGGLFALGMPRGSGKTTICECAVLWAVLAAGHLFVALIGADADAAQEMLESIKVELETNDLLLEDFPEVCYPVRCLEGIANRSRGQTYQGERTRIVWTGKQVVLPTIREAEGRRPKAEGKKKTTNRSSFGLRPSASGLTPSSGAVIKTRGITGRIRGMKYARPDGASTRPSFVVVDDPQTDESANSASQSAHRERIVAGAILGLAGPGKKIAGVMPCTVIRRGDLADGILDRNLHPEWQGERTKMVYAWPTDEKRWERYAELRAESLKNDGDGSPATKYYRRNRKAMDAGARVAWPERFNDDEISAIQHAVNLRLRDPAAFDAEYQNEPPDETASATEILTAAEIAAKVSGYKRAEVPTECNTITGMIDVQKDVLYWLVAGWTDHFTGHVLDYGAWPDQGVSYFTANTIRNTIAKRFRGVGLEGRLFQSFGRLVDELAERKWTRDDGAELEIDRGFIDANWGDSTETVYSFCRQKRSIWMPCHGRYIGASSTPIAERKRQKGDRRGLNWVQPSVKGKRAIRYTWFDANFWKSFVHGRLAVPLGDRGCLSLFKLAAVKHRLIADHMTAEYGVATTGRGRSVTEWKLRPNSPDNHWLDCLVGAAVAASICGCKLDELKPPKKKKRKRKKVSYLQ